MTRPSFKFALLRTGIALLVISSLAIIPNVSFTSWQAAASNALQEQNERKGNPKPGKPHATLPNLDTVRAEKPSVRETPISIPSTIPSRKNPAEPWNGRRVGDPFTVIGGGTNEQARLQQRAHARSRARVSAPMTMSEDAFIDNFYNLALPGYTPLTDEKPYWRDQFRAGYAHGQGSLLLGAIEMGKTLFESKKYDERARDNHWYVYDLYKTYLMRDPDAGGWAYWEASIPTSGRETVRRGFEESTELANLIATIAPTGSASGNQISFVSSRVDPRTQPGNGLLTRDATWSVPILSLPGRAGLDLGLNLSYSSQVWTKSGPFLYFDEDNGFPSPGFRQHVITLRFVARPLIGGTLLVGILFSARSPMAQKVDPPPAISLDFRCPTYPVSGVQPLNLVADILGTEDREIVHPLVFRWNISRGKIASGQGTPEITVADLGTTRKDIKIDLTVQGGPPELGNEKSCRLRVDPQCLVTPRIDQYGGISIDEEQQHLDRFAETLKASPPESIGYILSYAGKSACIYEAGLRGKRSLQYLVEKHNIPTKRLILVDGGFRDSWTVELFIQPNAACGPLASPTRRRVEVHVSGRCGS